MSSISKRALLVEKPSGNYSCPQFVDPKHGAALLASKGLSGDPDSVKFFTEVMENFGLALAESLGSIVTREGIEGVLMDMQLTD